VQRALSCQDACAYAIHPVGLGIVAVADGLGSAANSQVGARAAVNAAISAGTDVDTPVVDGGADLSAIARSAVVSARRAIEELARLERCEMRDLACTVIALATLENRVAVAHIGDGAVVGLSDADLILVSGPGDSEYTNEVVPVTADEWLVALRVTQPLRADCFAVFTDGCQRAGLRNTNGELTPYDRFFLPVFSYAKELRSVREGEAEIVDLLLSDKVCNNSDDDKTLVIGVLKR